MSGDDERRAKATESLRGHIAGDPEASEAFYVEVYDKLRRIAGRLMKQERPDHTLQPTALVNEAYLKLIDARNLQWQGHAHFCNVAARAMRQILCDHGKARQAQKRAGGWNRVSLSKAIDEATAPLDEFVAVSEAIDALARINDRAARVAALRIFTGTNHAETAVAVGVSERTATQDWQFARSWLADRLGHG